MSAHRSQISDALSQNGFTESEIGSSSKRYLAHTVEPSNLVSNFVVPGLPKAGCKTSRGVGQAGYRRRAGNLVPIWDCLRQKQSRYSGIRGPNSGNESHSPSPAQPTRSLPTPKLPIKGNGDTE